MKYEKLSGSFGFDTKLDYGEDVTFIGNNPINGTWYVNMRQYAIQLSITDDAGNSVYCTLHNDDHSLSGLEASLLIKHFFVYVENAVKRNNRLNRNKLQYINGRKVSMLWTHKKGS